LGFTESFSRNLVPPRCKFRIGESGPPPLQNIVSKGGFCSLVCKTFIGLVPLFDHWGPHSIEAYKDLSIFPLSPFFRKTPGLRLPHIGGFPPQSVSLFSSPWRIVKREQFFSAEHWVVNLSALFFCRCFFFPLMVSPLFLLMVCSKPFRRGQHPPF